MSMVCKELLQFSGDSKMAGKLEKFLECISCEKTIYRTYNRANEAINTFTFDKGVGLNG